MASQRAHRFGAVLDPADAGLVDAQLSALLESVEADRVPVRQVTETAGGLAPVQRTRPRRRARKARPERVRARVERRSTPLVSAGFAPKGLGVEPAWAKIPCFSDPAIRETAFYVIAATVLATGVGLLCAWLPSLLR